MHLTQLSQAQHRLWLLDQLFPELAPSNLAVALHIAGKLDCAALSWAVRELGVRHENLRSLISVDHDQPFRAPASVELELVIEDYSRLPAAERERALGEHLERESKRPFDHARAPLLRCFLLRESDERHVLALVACGVVLDRRALGTLPFELKKLYEARLEQRDPEAAPSAPSSVVERRVTSSAEPRVSSDYWTAKLAGVPSTLDLPFDHEPGEAAPAAARERLLLGSAESAALRALAQQMRSSLTALGLAALELVLGRASGQQDFLVTLLNDGRATSAEQALGMFETPLFLRSELAAGGTFADFLARVTRSLDEALEHGDVALDALSQLGLTGREHGNPRLHQLTFAVFDGPRRLHMADLELVIESPSLGAALADVAFAMHDDGTTIELSVTVAGDRYERETAARLCRSFRHVLEAAVAAPTRRLDDVPVLSPSDERRVVAELNETLTPWDEAVLVHRLFERQVDERPDAVALVFQERSLTFRELDQRANRLAHALVARGVSSDTLVGLSLRRGPELVISMLAILKAGGAYVPLDPDYPPERIEYVLDDSHAKVLITSSDLLRRLQHRPPSILLDSEREAIDALPAERQSLPERSDQLAYVIYTSGSTGKPKGVMVEHRNVTSFFAGMQQAIALDGRGCWLAGTSISFDISVLEILGSLCHGRKVALLGEAVLGQIENPRYSIAAQIKAHAVTHFQCTPSQARILLLDAAGRSAIASLEQLLLGGEALPQELAAELTALVRGQVVNMYGPTETTVWSSTARVERGKRVTIGRPIANTCLFVLDEQRRALPYGAVGELYIGGPGVARGYLNRPELTAERFVANALCPERSARLYRTGDLVRYGANGELVYLGRNDHQVKIRGHRIELGEIESVIRKHGGVLDVVVVARGETGDQRLVAYVVPGERYAGDDALRGALRHELPDFMTPAAFVHMSALPLTPNGKVDRKALPAPAAEDCQTVQYVPPRDADQRRVCAIWQRALGVTSVGLLDNFFELGGHSLLAVKISNEVEKEFGVRLPLATLFECPTVETFAQRLSLLRAAGAQHHAAHWTTLVPIQPRGTLPPFFCVAGVGGNPMNLRNVAEAMGQAQPFYGLQLRGVDGIGTPHRAVRAMADEFLGDLRKVQAQGPYYLGGYSFGGLVAYEMAQLLRAAGEQVALVVLFDTMNPALPGWTFTERLLAHLSNLRERGPAYFANRLLARLRAEIVRHQRKLFATLARFSPFQFRNDAVWVAAEEAMYSYTPVAYAGDVLLVQADARLTAGDGLGVRPHESNGWRELIGGRFEIAPVSSSHDDVVSGPVALVTARAVNQALAAARDRYGDSSPASSPQEPGREKAQPESNPFEEVA